MTIKSEVDICRYGFSQEIVKTFDLFGYGSDYFYYFRIVWYIVVYYLFLTVLLVVHYLFLPVVLVVHYSDWPVSLI